MRDGPAPEPEPKIPPPLVPGLKETLLLLLVDAAESERDRLLLFRMLERNFCALPSPFSFGAGPEELPAIGPVRMIRDEDASLVYVELGVAVPDPAVLPRVWSCIFF